MVEKRPSQSGPLRRPGRCRDRLHRSGGDVAARGVRCSLRSRHSWNAKIRFCPASVTTGVLAVAQGPAHRIGPYRVLRPLRNGGMAEVVVAVREGAAGFEKEVVLKRIRPQFMDQQEFVSMFLDEARIGSRLNHPGIAQVLDLAQADDRYYLVIEYVRGEDLDHLVDLAAERDLPFPAPLALCLCSQAAEALHHAHAANDSEGAPLGIVHRDVSPANMMVTADAYLKLLDFGVARSARRITQTVAGFVKGKLHYMAPEQLLGEPVDARADLFSLGCVLYELLALHHPFERETESELVDALAACDWTPLSHYRRDVSPGLEQILLRALWPTPEGRFANGRELHVTLERELRRYPYVPPSEAWARYRQSLVEAPDAVGPTIRRRSPCLRAIEREKRLTLVESTSRPGRIRPDSGSHEDATQLVNVPDTPAIGLGGAEHFEITVDEPVAAESRRGNPPLSLVVVVIGFAAVAAVACALILMR
jgi:eukaryotic-like serine/threonine-protein kinase